mgnify:CR=1 FL=1
MSTKGNRAKRSLNHHEENGSHPESLEEIAAAVKELRQDLFNLQKSAACALGHLELILTSLETREK